MNSQNVRERHHQISVYSPLSFKRDSKLEKKNDGPLTFQKTNIPTCTIQSIHQNFSPQKNLSKNNTINQYSVITPFKEQHSKPEDQQYQNNILDISEELLLSSQSISSKKNVGQGLICPIHLKNQEIICMIDKVKICAHCALFGNHKDHSFKAQAEIIQEIMKRKKEISYVHSQRQKLIDLTEMDSQWIKLKKDCKSKQKQLLSQVQNEYDALIKKIQGLKKQAEEKIIEKSNILQQQLAQQEIFYKSQIKSNRIFEQWISKGSKILQDLMSNLDQTTTFTHYFNEYQMFTWKQGAIIVQDYKAILSRSKQKIHRSISEMTSLPTLNSMLGTVRHDQFSSSNIQFASELNTSFTSIDDFQWINHRIKTDCSQLSQYDNEFLQMKEFSSNRKSELLQTIQEANRNSIKFIDKNQRMSAKCFSKKNNYSSNKKQNKFIGSASNSTFLNGKKSESKLQTSILPPKPRLTSPRSFCGSRQKIDPMIKLRQYQLNDSSRFLDLSDCGLSQDSLVYFLDKAQRIRPPQEVNLQRNHISSCGFSKLIPYLSSCKRINLSYCGVGQSCLDSLLRCKQLKVLTECILIGNQINQRKSKIKIQQLNKAGIKIILL